MHAHMENPMHTHMENPMRTWRNRGGAHCASGACAVSCGGVLREWAGVKGSEGGSWQSGGRGWEVTVRGTRFVGGQSTSPVEGMWMLSGVKQYMSMREGKKKCKKKVKLC